MLETLRIQNFKSWQDTGPIQFGALTGFFGTNSSGKTSILQFLLMLKQTVESSDRAQLLDLGDEDSYVNLGTFHDVVYNHEESRQIKFELEYQTQDILFLRREHDIPKGQSGFSVLQEPYNGSIKLAAAIRREKGANSVACFQYTFENTTVGISVPNPVQHGTKIPAKFSYNNLNLLIEERDMQTVLSQLPPPEKFYQFPSLLQYAVSNFGVLIGLSDTFAQSLRNVFYLGPLRDYNKQFFSWNGDKIQNIGSRGENAIAALLAAQTEGAFITMGPGVPPRTLEEHIAFWLQELKLIDSFSVRPLTQGHKEHFEVRVKRTPNAPEVLLNAVGFGVTQILPVLILLFSVPEGSTIILEHPELHLHPAAQAELADAILDAIKRRKVQIILESHSEHLLQRLQRRLAEEILPAKDVKLYFTKFEKAASEIEELRLDQYGNILNWPVNFFGDQFGEAAGRMREEIKRRQAAGEQ